MRAIPILIQISLCCFLINSKTFKLSSQDQPVYSLAGKTPVVEGFGLKNTIGSSFGIGYKLQTDIFAGYESNLFYHQSNYEFLIANPIAYLEIAFKSYLQLNLLVFNYRVMFDFETIRFDAADYSYALQLDDYSKHCSGLSYALKAL